MFYSDGICLVMGLHEHSWSTMEVLFLHSGDMIDETWKRIHYTLHEVYLARVTVCYLAYNLMESFDKECILKA